MIFERARQFFRRRVPDHLAAANHDELLGDTLGYRQNVRGQKNRDTARGERDEEVVHHLSSDWIDGLERLIQKQDLRVGQQRHGK